MKRYKFYTCDVFTNVRFGGNQLAVLPEAQGLSERLMLQIAREFNYSETTFVFPPREENSHEVRIFTPGGEVPFAGHPNIGTAFILATTGHLGKIDGSTVVTFEEKAGVVPVTVEKGPGGALFCELRAPEKLSVGRTAPSDLLADILNIADQDILTSTHPPQVASVGLPFLIAELRDLPTLAQAQVKPERLKLLTSLGEPGLIHLYTRCTGQFDLRARMFAPLLGVPEDPATGSANSALAGLLCHFDNEETSLSRWTIAQGIEMGRASTIHARAEKENGEVKNTWVGGACVLVGEGWITTD